MKKTYRHRTLGWTAESFDKETYKIYKSSAKTSYTLRSSLEIEDSEDWKLDVGGINTTDSHKVSCTTLVFDLDDFLDKFETEDDFMESLYSNGGKEIPRKNSQTTESLQEKYNKLLILSDKRDNLLEKMLGLLNEYMEGK
jgi:hypothetical protein